MRVHGDLEEYVGGRCDVKGSIKPIAGIRIGHASVEAYSKALTAADR